MTLGQEGVSCESLEGEAHCNPTFSGTFHAQSDSYLYLSPRVSYTPTADTALFGAPGCSGLSRPPSTLSYAVCWLTCLFLNYWDEGGGRAEQLYRIPSNPTEVGTVQGHGTGVPKSSRN